MPSKSFTHIRVHGGAKATINAKSVLAESMVEHAILWYSVNDFVLEIGTGDPPNDITCFDIPDASPAIVKNLTPFVMNLECVSTGMIDVLHADMLAQELMVCSAEDRGRIEIHLDDSTIQRLDCALSGDAAIVCAKALTVDTLECDLRGESLFRGKHLTVCKMIDVCARNDAKLNGVLCADSKTFVRVVEHSNASVKIETAKTTSTSCASVSVGGGGSASSFSSVIGDITGSGHSISIGPGNRTAVSVTTTSGRKRKRRGSVNASTFIGVQTMGAGSVNYF